MKLRMGGPGGEYRLRDAILSAVLLVASMQTDAMDVSCQTFVFCMKFKFT
jgi:hypothetical protein